MRPSCAWSTFFTASHRFDHRCGHFSPPVLVASEVVWLGVGVGVGLGLGSGSGLGSGLGLRLGLGLGSKDLGAHLGLGLGLGLGRPLVEGRAGGDE